MVARLGKSAVPQERSNSGAITADFFEHQLQCAEQGTDAFVSRACLEPRLGQLLGWLEASCPPNSTCGEWTGALRTVLITRDPRDTAIRCNCKPKI